MSWGGSEAPLAIVTGIPSCKICFQQCPDMGHSHVGKDIVCSETGCADLLRQRSTAVP